MSEEVVVAQELSLRRSEDLQAAGGPPDPPPVAPQKRLRSPRSPARVEHERVAMPPKEPAGSGSAEEPITIGSEEDPGVIPAEGVTTSGPTQTATPPPNPSNDTPADVVAPEGVTPVGEPTENASAEGNNGPTSGTVTERVSHQAEAAEPNQAKVVKVPEAPGDSEGGISDVSTPLETREGLMIAITRLGLAFVSTARKPDHEQFWKTMGLYDFVHLKWGNAVGNDDECREFIRNSTEESTKV
ncbi:unnamed protein product [Calypogeia fissa]